MDSLRRRVLERDRQHNSPLAMRQTARSIEARLICFDCRQTPDRVNYRRKWLEAHPLPEGGCDCSTFVVGNFAPERHAWWHEDMHVNANMPPFHTLRGCQYCQGQLIEVSW